jgi:hypothetical protein
MKSIDVKIVVKSTVFFVGQNDSDCQIDRFQTFGHRKGRKMISQSRVSCGPEPKF